MSDEAPVSAPAPVGAEPAQEAPKTPEQPKAPVEQPAQPKMRKVKVNGREEVVDEDSVFRDYQKYKSASELFEQASMSKKQVAEFMRVLQEDPEQILRNPQLNINRRDLAEKWLREEIERELEDPRDRRLKELEEENTSYKSKEEEKRQAQEDSEHQAKVSEYKQKISTDLEAAMEATVLKKDETTLKEMAAVMRMALEQGVEVTPEEVARHVESRKLTNFIQVAQRLDGDQLLDFLGQDVTNKIRKADLAKLRGPVKVEEPLAPKPVKDKPKEKIDRWEMIRRANEKLGIK